MADRPSRRDHPAIRFYARCVAMGYALAAVFTGLLLWQDVGGLRSLITTVQGGWLALFLLWFFNGIVMTGAHASVVLLLQAEPEEPSEPRGPGVTVSSPEPLRIRA